MKKFYLPILLVFGLCVSVHAQQLLDIEPRSVREQLTVSITDQSEEQIMKAVITNTSKRTLRLRWDKNVLYQPYVWETQVCDKEASYPPAVSSNYDPLQGVVAPIVLEPGERFDLFVTISAFNVKGQGKVEIIFREVDRPEQILGTASFQLNMIDEEDSERISRSGNRPSIYPNPVHDRFFLTNLPAETQRLDIYNTLGRKVRSFNDPQVGDSYPAGDLPQGVYLLSLIDRDGKVIRTLRLLRRDFRP
ncbi:MAG: T9SS type A sorting domain-containing protein [Bacteroidota bacterium]